MVHVDRTDLDEQLTGKFVAAQSLVGTVNQAESMDDLRKLRRTEEGGAVLSTIKKFRLEEKGSVPSYTHPRRDLIMIADEAHRAQYRSLEGFAYQLRQPPPNAFFFNIGFTGILIEETDRRFSKVRGRW